MIQNIDHFAEKLGFILDRASQVVLAVQSGAVVAGKSPGDDSYIIIKYTPQTLLLNAPFQESVTLERKELPADALERRVGEMVNVLSHRGFGAESKHNKDYIIIVRNKAEQENDK